MDRLYRKSANLLIVENLVDFYDRDAQGNPTPIESGVTVTGRIYAPDRETPLSDPIGLLQEPDQPQNYYRGVAPKTVDLEDYTEASVLFVVDGGGPYSYLERWKDVRVVEE